MEKTEHLASLDSAAEDQLQTLSEIEVHDVSGGAGNGKTNTVGVSRVPGAPTGLSAGRQHAFAR